MRRHTADIETAIAPAQPHAHASIQQNISRIALVRCGAGVGARARAHQIKSNQKTELAHKAPATTMAVMPTTSTERCCVVIAASSAAGVMDTATSHVRFWNT